MTCDNILIIGLNLEVKYILSMRSVFLVQRYWTQLQNGEASDTDDSK